MRKITIGVSRTIQVERFEPVTVTVEETVQVGEGKSVIEAREKLYAAVTKQVTSYVENEVTKYKAKAKKRSHEDD